ncbi:unnamed protein product, partial [Ectocarpus sp. 13 AM-2016]
LVEGDQETYAVMVKAKAENPEKFRWLLPHPGGWHIMLHLGKAMLVRYYGAGVESIARQIGADDKKAAGGGNARRTHHLMTITWEALMLIVREMYDAAGGKFRGVDMDLLEWLRDRAKTHVTLRFWTQYLTHDYPFFLAFRMGGRSGNHALCVAALREMAPIFAATGKTNYVKLTIDHLSTVARMPESDLRTVATLFSTSISGKDHTDCFLDENQQMGNRTAKGALTKTTPEYMEKLPRIIDDRAKAVEQVQKHLMARRKERQ